MVLQKFVMASGFEKAANFCYTFAVEIQKHIL